MRIVFSGPVLSEEHANHLGQLVIDAIEKPLRFGAMRQTLKSRPGGTKTVPEQKPVKQPTKKEESGNG